MEGKQEFAQRAQGAPILVWMTGLHDWLICEWKQHNKWRHQWRAHNSFFMLLQTTWCCFFWIRPNQNRFIQVEFLNTSHPPYNIWSFDAFKLSPCGGNGLDSTLVSYCLIQIQIWTQQDHHNWHREKGCYTPINLELCYRFKNHQSQNKLLVSIAYIFI